MIELPEALSRAKELNNALIGKKIVKVLLPTSPHKFCWFQGDVASYPAQLEGARNISPEIPNTNV